MTTQTLEQHEAAVETDGEAMLDYLLGQVEPTPDEILADVEMMVEDAVGEIHEEVRHAIATFGTWVADLHSTIDGLEARLLRGRDADDFEPDVDPADLAALAYEFEVADNVMACLDTATAALAEGLRELGEAPNPGLLADLDDNLEYAYWSAVKAKAETAEWLYAISEARDELGVTR